MSEAAWEIRCNSCGAAVPSTAEACPTCGTVLLGPASPPPVPATVRAAANPAVSVATVPSSRLPSGAPPYLGVDSIGSEWTPAGFWVRAAAWLIDTIILVVPVLVAVAFPAAWFVALPLVLLYYPVLESSRWHATLGKRFYGLTVITTPGTHISFVRALVRHLAKYLSGALFGIGYLMIAWRSDKRGLHDLIAGTHVAWRQKRRVN